MAGNRRWLSVGVIGMSGWLLSGCADLPDYAVPRSSLSDLISLPPPTRVERAQVSDNPVKLALPVPQSRDPNPPPLLDRPAGFAEKTPTPKFVPPPSGTGLMQVSSSVPRGTMRLRVRAWVNGRPIFEDEVLQGAGSDSIKRINSLPPSQQQEKMDELMKTVLKQIIDQELMYQDACRKLEKVSPTSLEKMKDFCEREFDKQLRRWREQKVPEEMIREIEPSSRRMTERNLIASEYARSRINGDSPKGSGRIGMDDVRDYYETHKNEFQTVDKVIWQDIFIPKGQNQSIADLKRFAEDLVSKCRRPEDFDRLMVYNDGDSKLRNGEGLGQRLGGTNAKTGKWEPGEIRPVELEIPLSKLRDGEIGPVVAFPLGVHLIRVTKREYARQLPLDDQVQKTIAKKLENERADREYRAIIDELRLRAVIRIEKEAP